jgi:ubiquinone/menaquinone biosynthesis C-methylase UbiE
MYRPPSLAFIEDMDIYLIDQILKGRYIPGQSILDAGTGGGRNLSWFLHEKFKVSVCDVEAEREEILKERYPSAQVHWSTCNVAVMPYADSSFDHVICSAVLHFSEDADHFLKMWKELFRVLRPKGSLFIRMASDIGINMRLVPLDKGRFLLPDGTERFLMTRPLWFHLLNTKTFYELEPMKSVNVADERVMTTMVLVKRPID